MNTWKNPIKYLGMGAEATVYECEYKNKPAALKLFVNPMSGAKAEFDILQKFKDCPHILNLLSFTIKR